MLAKTIGLFAGADDRDMPGVKQRRQRMGHESLLSRLSDPRRSSWDNNGFNRRSRALSYKKARFAAETGLKCLSEKSAAISLNKDSV